MLPKPVALVTLIGGSLTALILGGYLAARAPSVSASGGRPARVAVPEPEPRTPAAAPPQASAAPGTAGYRAAPASGSGASAAGGGAAAAGSNAASSPGGGGAAGGGDPGAAAGPDGGSAASGGAGGAGAVAMPAPMAPLPRARRPAPTPYPYYAPPYPQPGYVPPGAAAPEAPPVAAAPPVPVPPPAPAPRAPREIREMVVPANTKIEVMLEKELSSETASVEEAVTAIVSHDVRLGPDVAIPSGTRLRGTVLSVGKAGLVKGKAHVHLRFETLILPNEVRVDVQTPTMAYEGASPLPGTATKVGAGGAGGFLMGIVLGDRKAALTGLAAGAAGAGAAAMKTKRPGAVIPANEPFDIRLLAPIKVAGAW